MNHALPATSRRRWLGQTLPLLGGGLVAGLAPTWVAAVPAPATAAKAQPHVEVWKDPECGCCQDWIDHITAHGFIVSKVHTGGHRAVRTRLGLPEAMASCHTALVGGYLLEGHVPAADIRRLLQQKPQALGLAVPGMPIGSPGMDGPAYGGKRDAYQVLLVARGGASTSVWASYPAAPGR